jgi:acetyl-CoA carboxylase carboxyl transferase subunit alpha
MLENSAYAILSPEGFAAILWKDASRKDEACEVMHLTAPELKDMGIIDEIVPEPVGGGHLAPDLFYQALDKVLLRQLSELLKQRPSSLVTSRYQKFRQMGVPETP